MAAVVSVQMLFWRVQRVPVFPDRDACGINVGDPHGRPTEGCCDQLNDLDHDGRSLADATHRG